MQDKIQIYINERNNDNNLRKISQKTAFLISGGGTRGVFAVGILKYLSEDNPHLHLKSVSLFGGTSVGSFLSCALSLGFTKEDMIEMSKIIDLSNLIDSRWLLMLSIYRLISKGYLYDDTGRQNIIESILEYNIDIINYRLNLPDKIKGSDLTFGHLKKLIDKYPTIYKHLLLNAVDINRSKQIFMTTLNDKWNNIKLIDALLASSSIPYIFKPVDIYYYPTSDTYGYTETDNSLLCKLIDGGVSTNNPTDFLLSNTDLYGDYNVWLLNFTSQQKYYHIDGNISMLKQILDYLLTGKNDIKMKLVENYYKINTINLHSTEGTIELYTPEEIQNIINDIYNKCVTGQIIFGE